MRTIWIKAVVFLFILVSITNGYADITLLSQKPEKPKHILAWHFVLRHVSLERAYWMTDLAQAAGFNTAIVLITDGVKLDHAPWKPLPNAWSKQDLANWINYSRNKGIQFIPEVKLLSHQEKFFQKNYPNLMYDALSYNPDNPEVYKKVFALLEELIILAQPFAIHIGHDEVAEWNINHAKKTLNGNDTEIPAPLYQQDISHIHTYLKQKNIETWMWGDMLISPAEFPVMLDKHLHGSKPGYGKALRTKLPKDIVICDWHYFDDQPTFPSLTTMQDEGFRVLGATWKKEKTIRNFSQYAAQHNAYGMIATTWFHVQKGEWNIVDRIIKVSGETFNKDFPDAR